MQKITTRDLLFDVIHSTFIGLVNSIGKDCELTFIGFSFLQLPALIGYIVESLNGG